MTDREITEIQAVLHNLKKRKSPILVALDGRCGAGKTTFAAQIQKAENCNVIHMDDFFLRPKQRTAERLQQPGGNVDWERLREEVLIPLKRDIPFSYCPYDCHTQKLKEPVWIEKKLVTLVEGSYSCHPQLWDFYDLHIFLTVSSKEQMRRIRKRNGEEVLQVFLNKWIPLEEQYFQAFSIQKRCELCFDIKSEIRKG